MIKFILALTLMFMPMVAFGQCSNSQCQKPRAVQTFYGPQCYYGPAPVRGALIRLFQPRGYWVTGYSNVYYY